jgi:ABC-type sugar transport system substrate-binding protein
MRKFCSTKTLLHCLILVLAIAPLAGGCSPKTVSTEPASSPLPAASPTSDAWTAQDIAGASAPEKCSPVATLPKQRQNQWALGFIAPNQTHPFFVQRDAGMVAAAKFYDVKYLGLDAADASSYNLLPSLLEQKPDLVGSHNDVLSIAAKAQKEKIPFLSADLMPVRFGLHPFGVPDAQAGKLGGELLAQGLQERLAGEWKGKELFFLAFTAKSIPACVTRSSSAAQAVQAKLGIDDAHVSILDPNENHSTPQATLLAAMQEHPEAVFGLIPCWDQLGIDPYQAAAAKGQEQRLLLVTLGGDRSNLEFLKTKPAGYYGVVEFQPFCEGWSWVETAIAILEGVAYKPYMVSNVVTQSNVDARYAELYGDGEP